MENNVVSLETAEKLKAAGFSQNLTFAWFDGILELNEGFDIENPPDRRKEYAAPTAQEIADQIGPELTLYFPKSHWFACDAANKSTIAQHVGEGETMAEALASLWLNSQEGQDGIA